MSSVALPLLIAVALVLSAVLSPALLSRAAPVLARVPRLAIGLLLGGAALWLLAAAAIALALAWVLSGPRLLPTTYGDVCQACLAASSPFSPDSTLATPLPVITLLVLPAAALAILLLRGVRTLLQRRRDTALEHTAVRSAAEGTELRGRRVLMLSDPTPIAFALPRRRGGIVVSTGLVESLTAAELDAVLEHEHTHLRQRHHLILAVLTAFVLPLRRIPLYDVVLEAVPHYVEIAADHSARGQCGTPALAAALLKIGEHRHRPMSSMRPDPTVPLLHVAGPDRIGHLVAPTSTGAAWMPLAALLGMTLALATATVAVHGPYLLLLLRGCGLAV